MKQPITTTAAAAALGPYSQAIKVGGFVFVSGQLPIDPRTNTIPHGIAAQTEQSLLNVRSILEASGASLASAVKTTVYLQDLNHFNEMNEIYSTHFSSIPPARSTVQVARLPRDVLIEIEAIAHFDGSEPGIATRSTK